jgi:hypothetical protein
VEPLTIVAVVVSYLLTLKLEALQTAKSTSARAVEKRVTAVPASAAAK